MLHFENNVESALELILKPNKILAYFHKLWWENQFYYSLVVAMCFAFFAVKFKNVIKFCRRFFLFSSYFAAHIQCVPIAYKKSNWTFYNYDVIVFVVAVSPPSERHLPISCLTNDDYAQCSMLRPLQIYIFHNMTFCWNRSLLTEQSQQKSPHHKQIHQWFLLSWKTISVYFK